MNLDKFFKKGELIPVSCQDERNNEVLMLGYANKQALANTMETGTAWFFSRSRQKLWNKTDCDDDTLIYRGIPKGPTCHTGNRTCFYQEPIWKKPEE